MGLLPFFFLLWYLKKKSEMFAFFFYYIRNSVSLYSAVPGKVCVQLENKLFKMLEILI